MKHIHSNLTKYLLGLVAIIIATLLVSCDDDDTVAGAAGEFAMITSTLNNDFATRAFFLQRVSVDSTGAIDNSSATELDPQGQAMVHSYNGAIYYSDYQNGRIVRYSINEFNNVTNEGSIQTTDLGSQGNTFFADESTAFVGGLSTDIVIFNPTTMTRTGTIDFSAVSKIGDASGFTGEGTTFVGEAVTEIMVRDNILFASLMSLSNIEGGNFIPADKGCSIIVIDLNEVDINVDGNAEAVVKRIYDERGSHTGAWGSGGGNYFMHLDENNDIYMLSHNMWANPSYRPLFNPACILRIANGETEFDQNYYFDLESASGGLGNGVMNFEYYGNGKFLAAVQDPSVIDPNNPFSYFTDPIFQWWSFDLNDQSASIVTEEYTRGALAAKSYFEAGSGYVPFESNGENFVLKVDLSTLEATKHFETVGLPQLYSLE
ncbi:MAG: DUF4374 domain-containing protein [Bacteroidota bacterium]